MVIPGARPVASCITGIPFFAATLEATSRPIDVAHILHFIPTRNWSSRRTSVMQYFDVLNYSSRYLNSCRADKQIGNKEFPSVPRVLLPDESVVD